MLNGKFQNEITIPFHRPVVHHLRWSMTKLVYVVARRCKKYGPKSKIALLLFYGNVLYLSSAWDRKLTRSDPSDKVSWKRGPNGVQNERIEIKNDCEQSLSAWIFCVQIRGVNCYFVSFPNGKHVTAQNNTF